MKKKTVIILAICAMLALLIVAFAVKKASPSDKAAEPLAAVQPTAAPTAAPTAQPTEEPTAAPTAQPTEEPTPEPEPITVVEIQKYGNLVLSLSGSELLGRGFAYGDVVTVTVNGQAYDMPVGSNYSDVDQGSMICRVVVKADQGEDYVILAINMGDLATTAGIAVKEKTEAAPGYVWHYQEGVAAPVTVSIEMKESAGYYSEWLMRQLVRSEKREDYPGLTDAEFANFRAVEMGDIAPGRLYRSSSPVNPEIARNAYADDAAEAAGVKVFVDLADNEETLTAYPGYGDTYYSHQAHVALNLGVDFSADDFKAGLAEGLRFMAGQEGPYLVHCNEGKDRAGFVSAILECLMGATAEEVAADYMMTYYNYYGVAPGTEQYEVIADSNIRKSLCTAFGLASLEGADLRVSAEAYLLGIGLTEAEIDNLRTNLAK